MALIRFPVLPVGNYVLEVNHPGFEPYRRTGIVLDTNSVLLVDVILQVGERTDAVTVSDSAVHLETSSSQMGEVISSKQMSAVPWMAAVIPICSPFSPALRPQHPSHPARFRTWEPARFRLRAI